MKTWKVALAISLTLVICIVVVRIATHGRLEMPSLFDDFKRAGRP